MAQVALRVPPDLESELREGAEPGLRDFQIALRRLFGWPLPKLPATRDAGKSLLKNGLLLHNGPLLQRRAARSPADAAR